MRGHYRDVTGNKFGRLTANTPRFGVGKGRDVYWECLCECGNKPLVRIDKLLNGTTKSCGCLHDESHTTHGHTRHGKWSPEYSSWAAMMRRCLNPKEKAYAAYGAKGVVICPRWQESFENFLADMGERPQGTSLDRIDGTRDYEPGNCRWATRRQQSENRSNARRITFQNETLNISQWAKRIGLPAYLIRQRIIRDQWSAEKALTTPR